MEEQTHETVIDRILPIIEETSDIQVVYDNDRHAYALSGFDTLISQVDEVETQLDDYRFDPEDKAKLKDMNAQVRKYNQQVDRLVIDTKASLGAVLDEQRKVINTRLNGIMKKMKTMIDAADNELREENRASLVRFFEDNKQLTPELSDTALRYEDVSDAAWANISASQNMAQKEMTVRMRAVQSLMRMEETAGLALDDLLQALRHTEWRGLEALQYIRDKEQEAIEEAERKKLLEEAREARRQKMEMDRQMKEKANITVTLTLTSEDWQKVEGFMSENGIRYLLK